MPEDKNADIAATQAQWETEVVAPALRSKPETRAEFRTGSGDLPVQRLYTAADVPGFDYLRDLGFPGQPPYTRGLTPAGFRNHQWPVDFYSGHGSSADTNQWYRQLRAQGATNLRLAMDLPTQLGLDPDHPQAHGEVGRVGVAVSSLADMERVFDGIPLDQVSTGTVGNCIGPYAVALFASTGLRQGIDPRKMRVVMQNDPLKAFTGRGTYIFPVSVSVDLAADTLEYVTRHFPNWVPQYACSTQMRWAGISAAQEIGFGLANLLTYIDAGVRRGLKLEEFAPKMDWHASCDNDLFEEAAKFRAGRRLYAKLMRERYGTEDPKVLGLRITVFTAANRLTAQQPMNNIVRTTLHVLAAMLGGVERISTPSYDEALTLPTLEATRLANLTKQIIHFESGVNNTVDPLGGSYYVEALTEQLEAAGRRCFDEVERQGGAVAAIESGYYDQKMTAGLYRYQREVEAGERVVVGVNSFTREEEVPIDLFQGNAQAEADQTAAVRRLKAERSQQAVQAALAELRRVAEAKAAGRQQNIMPAMLAAVQAYATVGEIFGELRVVFGEHQPNTHRPAVIP